MDNQDVDTLSHLWREVWDRQGDSILGELEQVGPRHQRFLTLVDRAIAAFEHQVLTYLRHDRFRGRGSRGGIRGMPISQIPLGVTWENHGARSEVILRIAIDCPLLHRGPWFLQQAVITTRSLREVSRAMDNDQTDAFLYGMRALRSDLARANELARLANLAGFDRQYQQQPTDPPPRLFDRCRQCQGERRTEYSIEGKGAGFCRGCYEASLEIRHSVMRLIDICKVIANAVALRWAAALSTHPVAILRTDRTRLWAVCHEHSANLAHCTALDSPPRYEYDCGPCRHRRELLVVAVSFLTQTMLLAAHALWAHQVDDMSKRYMMLELGEAPPYVAPRERSGYVDSPVDRAGVETLLLEME